MSIKVNLYNQKAESVGELSLKDKVFKVAANNDLLHQAVVAQQANQRQVLAHTKGRGEVRGGGKKPWRQKGTGRARAGSSRSPIWIGGGVTFGPTKDRNFTQKINLKMKRKALLMVISDKVASNAMAILDKWDVQEFKTKSIDNVISSFEKKVFKNKAKRSILIVSDQKDEKLKYSARNLAGTEIINLDNINVVDLLKYKYLLVTENVVKTLEQRYNK